MKAVYIAVALMVPAAGALAMMSEDARLRMMVDDKMRMMDSNNDGSVSMDEHQAAMQTMFTTADVNGDKVLSRDEVMNHKKKEMDKYNDAPVSNDTKTNKMIQ